MPEAASVAAVAAGIAGACLVLLGGGLTGAPGMPTAGSRMDCEALESTVTTELRPPDSALSHDLTCRNARRTSATCGDVHKSCQ